MIFWRAKSDSCHFTHWQVLIVMVSNVGHAPHRWDMTGDVNSKKTKQFISLKQKCFLETFIKEKHGKKNTFFIVKKANEKLLLKNCKCFFKKEK